MDKYEHGCISTVHGGNDDWEKGRWTIVGGAENGLGRQDEPVAWSRGRLEIETVRCSLPRTRSDRLLEKPCWRLAMDG
jgi:hypothetical protein